MPETGTAATAADGPVSRVAAGAASVAWISTYLCVYAALLAVAIGLAERAGIPAPPEFGLNDWLQFAVLVLGLFYLVPMAIGLALLRLFRGSSRLGFRLAAIVLCCLPSVCASQGWQLAAVLPAQLLTALLVRAPRDGAGNPPHPAP